MENIKRTHSLHLENGNLKINGVVEVSSFDDGEIKVALESRALLIKGSELNVAKLSIEEGQLVITGKINEIAYDKVKVPFFKRLIQ